jgi:hypothetical protein
VGLPAIRGSRKLGYEEHPALDIIAPPHSLRRITGAQLAGKCTGALAVGAPGTTLVTLRADDRHYDGTDRIVICAQIDAPRDRVWRALTEEEQIPEWWGRYVSLDAPRRAPDGALDRC